MNKKLVFWMFLTSLFVVGCGTNSEAEEASTTSESEIVKESEEKEQTRFTVYSPNHSLEHETFVISGKTEPNEEIKVFSDGGFLKMITASASGSFEFSGQLPKEKNISYRFESLDQTQAALVKSIDTLEYELLSDEEQKIADKEAEEKEKAKEEEEARQKVEAAAKREEERREKQRQEQEKAEVEKSRRASINNASREFRNALAKAEQYLDYSSFSKSGLYDQLLFEKYPEDAAQFAVDNVNVDWNEQAVLVTQRYLDYSAFSDQGLYDQLIFEGFTQEQAQYAIDNLD